MTSRLEPGPLAAAGALALFVAVQVVAAILVVLLRGGAEDPVAVSRISLEALVVGYLAAAALVAALCAGVAPTRRRDGAPTGLGLTAASPTALAVCATSGALGALVLAATLAAWWPLPAEQATGPVAAWSRSDGLGRWIWATLALLAAPVEEALFRG